MACTLTFWLQSEYAVWAVKTSIFSLWHCNKLSKTLLLCDATVVSQNRKKKKKKVTSLLNTMQRGISSSSVLKRYGKSFVPWRWCCSTTYRRTTPQACNGDVCCSYKDSLAGLCHLQRSFNTSQNSARAPLYSKDSILLLKPIESSTVHLLRLYEREMICPRVDCTVLILSCWEGWCAQLTLLWKVEVILGSLHFANPGE